MIGAIRELAIIIPAFKGKFLADTLESIAAQTSNNFRVYVGDDASPEPLAAIVRNYDQKRFPIAYHRFDCNLGSTSLVKHWERCVALTSERWIWLFSDDDIMDPTCVERFYRAKQASETRSDVFRFNTLIIDAKGKVTEINPPHPKKEDCLSLLYFFLRGLRAPVMQDHIFSRAAYDRLGGIPAFPLAWCSDHALALSLGSKKGFVTVADANVYFRQSGQNLSSIRNAKVLSQAKAKAALVFSEWVLSFIDSQPTNTGALCPENLRKLTKEWLIFHLKALHTYLGPRDLSEIVFSLERHWGEATVLAWLHAVSIDWNNLNVQIRNRLRSYARKT